MYIKVIHKGVENIFNILKFINKNNKLLSIINSIRDGDDELRNKFISEYEPFILSCVSHVMYNRYVDKRNNDEFSIGLIAFNEAIDKFDENKNNNFFDFAQLVITRRVMTHRIREKKHRHVYPFTSFGDGDESNESIIYDKTNVVDFNSSDQRDELLDFKQKLKYFDIDIMELADNVPKHRDSKVLCIKIARLIVENRNSYSKLIKRRMLPVNDIISQCNCSRRTLERNRKFIIASVIILESNLDILKEFISNLY